MKAKLVLPILGFALLVAAGVLRELVYFPRYGDARTLHGACLFDGQQQPVLASLEGARAGKRSGNGVYFNRLTFIDLKGGARIAREVLGGDEVRIAGCGPDFLWLEEDRHLVARDGRTGAVLVTGDALVAANPALSAGLLVGQGSNEWTFVQDTGELVVRTVDARLHAVAPRTWAVSDVDPGRFRPQGPSLDHGARTSSGERAGALHLSLEGDQRVTLFVDRRPVPISTPYTDGFLRGEFLRGALFSDPVGALVVHRGSLANNSATLLTRLAADGKVIWTQDVGVLHLEELFTTPTLLVVAGKTPDEEFTGVAFNATTGARLWTYRF